MKYFLTVVLVLMSSSVFAQDIPGTVAQAKSYRLGPGDKVTVKVLGEKDFDFVASVNSDGKIEVPFFDTPISAQCRTERELRADIAGVLSKQLRNPQINLQVESNSRSPATVYGEVKAPGGFILMRKVTLIEMLAQAGGSTEDAGGMVQVFRPHPPICDDDTDAGTWQRDTTDATSAPSRLYSLANVKLGKDEANPVIYPGDVIVVLKAPPVYITGEVERPSGLFLKEGGMSLTQALGIVGGVKPGAKTKEITIRRQKVNSKEYEIIPVNYELIAKGEKKDMILQPYDIVEVGKSKDSMAMTVLKIAAGLAKAGASSTVSGGGYRIIN